MKWDVQANKISDNFCTLFQIYDVSGFTDISMVRAGWGNCTNKGQTVLKLMVLKSSNIFKFHYRSAAFLHSLFLHRPVLMMAHNFTQTTKQQCTNLGTLASLSYSWQRSALIFYSNWKIGTNGIIWAKQMLGNLLTYFKDIHWSCDRDMQQLTRIKLYRRNDNQLDTILSTTDSARRKAVGRRLSPLVCRRLSISAIKSHMILVTKAMHIRRRSR